MLTLGWILLGFVFGFISGAIVVLMVDKAVDNETPKGDA